MTQPCDCGAEMVLVELPEVYDGGLYWGCCACGATRQRWTQRHDPRLYALAEKYRVQWTTQHAERGG